MPLTQHTFTIDVEGELTRKRYVGEFTCRIARRKEICLIDKHRAYLNGELVDQLSADTINFHYMIAYLRYTLTETPKFWSEADLGYDLYDANVVRAVYEQVLAFEESWVKQIWGDPNENLAKEKTGAKAGEKA